jgi:hypothetical protein
LGEFHTDHDVGQPGPAAPHDSVSRRRVTAAGQPASEAGNFGEKGAERSLWSSHGVSGRASLEHIDLG